MHVSQPMSVVSAVGVRSPPLPPSRSHMDQLMRVATCAHCCFSMPAQVSPHHQCRPRAVESQRQDLTMSRDIMCDGDEWKAVVLKTSHLRTVCSPVHPVRFHSPSRCLVASHPMVAWEREWQRVKESAMVQQPYGVYAEDDTHAQVIDCLHHVYV